MVISTDGGLSERRDDERGRMLGSSRGNGTAMWDLCWEVDGGIAGLFWRREGKMGQENGTTGWVLAMLVLKASLECVGDDGDVMSKSTQEGYTTYKYSYRTHSLGDSQTPGRSSARSNPDSARQLPAVHYAHTKQRTLPQVSIRSVPVQPNPGGMHRSHLLRCLREPLTPA